MGNGAGTGPPRVQIQTQSGCNGRCIFCPNETTLKSGFEMGKMPFELFQRIIDQLAETGPEKVMLYLQNEPLNDARLPQFVEYLSKRIPETTSLVTSNGTRLTPDMGEGLVEAGLKRLKVSLQSLDDETNKRIMGYEASNVVENVLAFKELLKRKRSRMDLRVSMVVHSNNFEEIEDARRFWKKHGIRLVTSALENRGGNIAGAEDLNLGRQMTHCNQCIRPSREMCVLFNGQVVLCCVDWFRTVVCGDLSQQSLSEVWNSGVYRHVRAAFLEGDMSKLPEICVNCTESACPNGHRRQTPWRQLVDSFLGPFVGKPAPR